MICTQAFKGRGYLHRVHTSTCEHKYACVHVHWEERWQHRPILIYTRLTRTDCAEDILPLAHYSNNTRAHARTIRQKAVQERRRAKAKQIRKLKAEQAWAKQQREDKTKSKREALSEYSDKEGVDLGPWRRIQPMEWQQGGDITNRDKA